MDDRTIHLIPSSSGWQNLPTKTIRIPQAILEQVIKYAKELDSKLAESQRISYQGSLFEEDKPLLENVIADIRSLPLRDVKRLCDMMPRLLWEVAEGEQDKSLEKAILYLASCCDHAGAKDGAGFNKVDAHFGHWLAGVIKNDQRLLRDCAGKAHKMVIKYKRQLEEQGIALTPWKEIAETYPLSLPPLATKSNKRVEVVDGELAVYCPYDSTGEHQKKCKHPSLGGSRFNQEDRSWRFPLVNAEAVVKMVTDESFQISFDVQGAIAYSRTKRLEDEVKKEEARRGRAKFIEDLKVLSDPSGRISNGWFLRDYQKEGVVWLWEHSQPCLKQGGLVADDMGLGKTLMSLFAAKALSAYFDNCPIIVLCPASVQDNWTKEAGYVECPIEVYSWAKIPKPLKRNYILIADEAHYAQSINSRRSKGMVELALSEYCQAAWLLTGTPMKNGRPINLFPLLKAIRHPLGINRMAYERRYCAARRKSIGKKQVWDNTGAAFLDELHFQTQPDVLRRTKKQCLDELPEKTRFKVPVVLPGKEITEYETTISGLVQDYKERIRKGEVDKNAEALVILGYIRKVSSRFKTQAAIAKCQELLEQGKQVVIFSEFKDTIREIAKNFSRACVLDGETPTKDRQDLVERFQSGQFRVFVTSSRAGGVGITLTAASDVILIDRGWTPGDVEQAEDRCYRQGQKNAVFATWLQLGSADFKIDNLLEEKKQRIDKVLAGERKTMRGTGSIKDAAADIMKDLTETAIHHNTSLRAGVVMNCEVKTKHPA